jgi:multidrug efflux system membrane fusion protein
LPAQERDLRFPVVVEQRVARLVPDSPMSSSRHHLPALAAVLCFAACGPKSEAKPAAGTPPPPTVTVAKPVVREVVDFDEYTGRIEAAQRVDVRARVAGFLQSIEFKEGSEVAQGDLLYRIDPRTYEAALAQTRADVERLQAEATRTEAEAERAQSLVETAVFSREQYEQRVAARAVAAGALEGARAAMQRAELELGYTEIRAPIAGRIGRTLVTVGNLVGQGEPTLLTTIVQVDPVYVVFEVPERDYLAQQRRIREQGVASDAGFHVPLFVALEDERDYPHEGRIDFRDNVVDPETGTILIRGVVADPERVLTPGLFVRVRIPRGAPIERVMVPETALSADQRGPYVLTVGEGGLVASQPVRVGNAGEGGLVAVEGLARDAVVVVSGVQRTRAGGRVTPRFAEETATGGTQGAAREPAPRAAQDGAPRGENAVGTSAAAPAGAAPTPNSPLPPPQSGAPRGGG